MYVGSFGDIPLLWPAVTSVLLRITDVRAADAGQNMTLSAKSRCWNFWARMLKNQF